MDLIGGDPRTPGRRLLSLLDPAPPERAPTVVLVPGREDSEAGIARLMAAHAGEPPRRLLVLAPLGTHPDARSPWLRLCWAIEERARATGWPVLVLRVAPMIGARSPLWLHLRSHPSLGSQAQRLVQPVAEEDVLATLVKALGDEGPWGNWYEVAGDPVMTLAELRHLAEAAGPRLPAGSGAWEPDLGDWEDMRLADPGPWRRRFDIAGTPSGAVGSPG